MKKVFVLLCLLIFSNLSTLADDLQNKWEDRFSHQQFILKLLDNTSQMSPDDIIKSDYLNFLEKKKSFYSLIHSTIDNEKYFEYSPNNLNKKYIDIVFNKYYERLKATTTHTYLAGIISVPDNEYKNLNENVKQLICIYNYVFAQDI